MCATFIVQAPSAQALNFDMIERNANTDVKLTLKDSHHQGRLACRKRYVEVAMWNMM